MAEEKSENFERLVSGLSDGERKSMLEKMGPVQTAEVDSAASRQKNPEKSISVELRLKKESIFLRIMLWIQGLVKGVSSIELYKSLRVDRIAKATESRYRNLIDHKNGKLLGSFHENLSQVKLSADFFMHRLIAVEQAGDEFLLFLASVVLPEFSKEIETKCNPYSQGEGARPSSDMRSTFMRRLDEILEGIDPESRQKMYVSVKSIEWLKEFAGIPYGSILGKFTAGENKALVCKYDLLDGDIKVLAKVFCNVQSLTKESLEALFYFSSNDESASMDDGSPKETAEKFVEDSGNQLSIIKMFVSNVPFSSLGKIINDDADWQPPSFGGGEDWFVKFKSQWKTKMDRQIDSWVHDFKKEELRKAFHIQYCADKLPILPNRPWSSFSKDFPFKYELTSGFLLWFFNNVFKKIEPVLKIVLLEGDFALKDNRLVFSDAYNDFMAANTAINTLDRKLLPEGELGSEFQKLVLIGVRSAQGKSKISSLLSIVETTVDSVLKLFGNSCRAMTPIIKGFFSASKSKAYGPLMNFMMIKGKENEKFRENLEYVNRQIEIAYDFIMKLEPVDTPSIGNIS